MFAVIYRVVELDEDYTENDWSGDNEWCLAESKEEAAKMAHTLIEHYKQDKHHKLDGWGIAEIQDSDIEMWIQKRDLGLED
jgi:hypothetical protein